MVIHYLGFTEANVVMSLSDVVKLKMGMDMIGTSGTLRLTAYTTWGTAACMREAEKLGEREWFVMESLRKTRKEKMLGQYTC